MKDKRFQIIIPMSGYGERFRKAGYKIPKPLIKVEGKPIIAHVIDMFPGESEFIFICNKDHLEDGTYRMQEIIEKYCSSPKIIPIEPHKLGPVHAVLQAKNWIDLSKETIVNYCDFSCYWDWEFFKSFVKRNNCEGAIPAYKGFHPHSLGTTNYAYIRENSGIAQDIQEKQPFTSNRMEEYASSGTYYYSSGKLMVESFEFLIKEDMNLNGEFYVSLSYKYFFRNDLKVCVFPLQHFMQWGTPEDLHEYNLWSNLFHNYTSYTKNEKLFNNSLIMPMAGLGKRFSDEGYQETKPLIKVSGLPMVIQAINDLPPSEHHVLVLRSDMKDYKKIIDLTKETYENPTFSILESVTDGQATSAKIGLDELTKFNNTKGDWITFGACDNGVLYDQSKLLRLIEDDSCDIIVWTFRGHSNAIRSPNMYGWIDVNKNNLVEKVSVKKPLSNPSKDPIIIGTFSFKNKDIFYKVYEELIKTDSKINGEFYLDSCIDQALKLNLKCVIFEVDNFVSWGTPNELRTFEYWQSCFHKWESHPYSINKDKRIPVHERNALEKEFRNFNFQERFSN